MKKKYRLGYDYLFLSHPAIKVGNREIGYIALNVKFKLFYVDSNIEILFDTDEDQIIGKVIHCDLKDSISNCYMSEFLKCSFDKKCKKYIKFEEINKEILKELGYLIEYEIDSYSMGVFTDTSHILTESEEISEEEFYRILTENFKNFDNIDNAKAQTCSYTAYPVEV